MRGVKPMIVCAGILVFGCGGAHGAKGKSGTEQGPPSSPASAPPVQPVGPASVAPPPADVPGVTVAHAPPEAGERIVVSLRADAQRATYEVIEGQGMALGRLVGRSDEEPIRLPVGTLVRLELDPETSIGLQLDPPHVELTPEEGSRTVWLQADRPAELRSQCLLAGDPGDGCGHRLIVRFVQVGTGDSSQPAPAVELPLTPAAIGQILFAEHGCGECHAAAEDGVGPKLAGSLRAEHSYEDGTTLRVTKDTAFSYLTGALTDPSKKVRKGFEPDMPKFTLQPQEIEALLAFIDCDLVVCDRVIPPT